MSNMIDLPTYNEDNWSVISRGTGSTNPVYSDEGIITPGRYNFQVWKQAITTDKEYNIYFYQSTNAYRGLYLGLCNSNTSTPTRYPTIPSIADYGAVTGINKARIFYDETTRKWYIQINDGIAVSQLEHVENGRYIDIQSTTGDISNYKILAITETSNGGGAMSKYTVTVEADTEEHPFTQTHPFVSDNSGTSKTITQNGTIKLGTSYETDYFRYNNDEDWIIHTQIQINTLQASSLQIATTGIGDGHNGGVWNIHGKWIDYNDNTDSGSRRIQLDNLQYGNDSTLDIQITKNDDTITWKITDDNGNTQTIPLANFTQSQSTRLAFKTGNTTTDIEVAGYTRLTKIE